MKDNSKRLIYLDLLRMLAVFGVIIVHTSAMMVIQYPATNGIVWNSINVFNGLGRFAVPIFIMLTGGLLLDENRPLEIRSFYKKIAIYGRPASWLGTILWRFLCNITSTIT